MTLVDVKLNRRKIEEKDKSLRPKVMTLKEAVSRFVFDGAVVALGGCLYSRTPMAAVHEVLRQGFKNLTLVRNLAGYEVDLLLASGCLKKLVASWCAPGYAWGMSKVLRHYVENRLAEFEEWSHLGIGLRLTAAAMGIPSIPTFSMLGSDIEKNNGLKHVECPYSGVKMLMVPALYPDVAVIHGSRVDVYGNIQIDGYVHMDREMALAAGRVIATAEEVVNEEFTRHSGDRTLIPYFCVDAVVEQPFGAYPSECWNLYDTDFSHMNLYQKKVEEKGVEGAREYIQEYITGVDSFTQFLEKTGLEKLFKNRRSFRDVIE
ncbi:MAG: CoA transferase subunit A [Candidatus Caldarchaeum sp.]|nr:CoA transferase subunit A [Candidatus Caldarchaeum sp.]MDW8360138.1 CoA-transferase [Candidatus Caldarchaeum sp.]